MAKTTVVCLRNRINGLRPEFDVYGGRTCIDRLGRSWLDLRANKWSNPYPQYRYGGDLKICLDLYKKYFWSKKSLWSTVQKELKGKVLACWCVDAENCHCEFLAELANREEPIEGPPNNIELIPDLEELARAGNAEQMTVKAEVHPEPKIETPPGEDKSEAQTEETTGTEEPGKRRAEDENDSSEAKKKKKEDQIQQQEEKKGKKFFLYSSDEDDEVFKSDQQVINQGKEGEVCEAAGGDALKQLEEGEESEGLAVDEDE